MMPKPSFQLCKHRHRPDAVCRRLPRCRACDRVLKPFERGWVCADCKTERDDRPDETAVKE
jgi:hypothetical protein